MHMEKIKRKESEKVIIVEENATLLESSNGRERTETIMSTVIKDDIDPEDNWPALSLDIFRGWYPFFELGLPGALSLFLEWFYSSKSVFFHIKVRYFL